MSRGLSSTTRPLRRKEGGRLGSPSGAHGRNRTAHDLSGQHEAAAGGLVDNRHDMVGQRLGVKMHVVARNGIYENGCAHVQRRRV